MAEICNINQAVEQYYDHLRNFIQTKVSDKETAEDLTQEVMFELTKSCEQPDKIQNTKAWLFRVARNTIYDYYQKHRDELNESQLEHLSEAQKIDMPLDAKDYIHSMMAYLPAADQEILELADIQEMPQKEIADKLGLGLSATKMRVKRAREKLLSQFNQCCVIEFDAQGHFAGCTIKPFC